MIIDYNEKMCFSSIKYYLNINVPVDVFYSSLVYVWLSLMCKMILDWREFSHCDYHLVCVRLKEDCTIRWDKHCKLAVQSWKFSKKKLQ